MQKITHFTPIAALPFLLVILLCACGQGAEEEEEQYPMQYLQEGETIEDLFDLVGARDVSGYTAAYNGKENNAVFVIFAQYTADGGIVAWCDNHYIYIPNCTNLTTAQS